MITLIEIGHMIRQVVIKRKCIYIVYTHICTCYFKGSYSACKLWLVRKKCVYNILVSVYDWLCENDIKSSTTYYFNKSWKITYLLGNSENQKYYFLFFFNFFNMIGISWFTCKGQVTCTLASNMLLLICAFNINLFLQALQRYHKQANTNHAEGLPIRINK